MCPPGDIRASTQGEHLPMLLCIENLGSKPPVAFGEGGQGAGRLPDWALPLNLLPVCLGFRIGTREVHNKLEKNRCVCVRVCLWARPAPYRDRSHP